MKINIPQNKDILIKIVIILFIILMCVLLFFKIHMDNNPTRILEEQEALLFSTVDKNVNVNITKYTVYGTHFNIEGTLDIIKISGININYVDLILKDLDGNEMRN